MAPLSRDSLLRIGVFLATVIVVVIGSTAAPHLTGPGVQQQANPAFESGLVPDRAPDKGQVALGRVDHSGLIVIDATHANRFDHDQIQPLVEAISSAGYEVEIASGGSVGDAIEGADGLVVIDPGQEYSQSEVDNIERFVDNGGRLVMIGEPPTSQIVGGLFTISIRTVRSQFDSLSKAFGFEFGESYLFNTGDNDGNFRNIFAESKGSSPIVAGVDRTSFYTATSVSAANGQTVLQTTSGYRSVRGDTPGQYPVAARNGNVLAIGDKTFLSRDNFNVVDNDRFIENVARFLIAGDYRQTLADYPALTGESPTIRYTKVRFFDAAQRVEDQLRGNGQDVTLSLRRGARAPNGSDVLITTYDYLENNDIGTDSITVSDGRVAVTGYESSTTGVILFHAPPTGPDLVVVVDGPSRARRAAELLESGEFEDYLINDRTAVIRTASA